MSDDNWISVSKGIYPDDDVTVQLTIYSGWEWEEKHKRNCEIFACRRNGKWVQDDDGKYINEIKSDRVIAWRKCIPYQGD